VLKLDLSKQSKREAGKLGSWGVVFRCGSNFFIEAWKREMSGSSADILTRISKNLKKPNRFLKFL